MHLCWVGRSFRSRNDICFTTTTPCTFMRFWRHAVQGRRVHGKMVPQWYPILWYGGYTRRDHHHHHQHHQHHHHHHQHQHQHPQTNHKPTINQPFTWSFPQTSHGPHLTQHPSPTCSAIRRICRRIRQQQLAQRLGAILSKHRSHAGVTWIWCGRISDEFIVYDIYVYIYIHICVCE